MPITEQVAETLIRENIVRAVGDVFKTMLSRPVRLQVPTVSAPDAWPGGAPAPVFTAPQIVGTVGFIGDINGLMYLYLEETFALRCTGDMLGMSDVELSETGAECVNDAIGEITNMVVGSFKNGLCDAGFPCKLTIPSILRGRDFCVELVKSSQRYVYTFESQGHRVVADILLKSED